MTEFLNNNKNTEQQQKENSDIYHLLLVFFTIIIVGGTGYFIYLLFSVDDPKVRAAIIAGLVALASVLLTKALERRALNHSKNREKKEPSYEQVVAFMLDALFAERLYGQPLSEKDIHRRLSEIMKSLILWGSDEVVEAFVKFKSGEVQEEEDFGIIFRVEEVLLAMRKDFDHANNFSKEHELLRLFITDLDSALGRDTDTTDSAD